MKTMKGIVLQSNSEEDLKLLIALAEKLGVRADRLSDDDLEAAGLTKAIEEGKTGQHIDTESFLQSLEDDSKD